MSLAGVHHLWRDLACPQCLEGGDWVLHLWGVEKALSGVHHRLQGLWPVREAFRGAPRVGEEGRPERARGRRHWLFAGDDRREAVDGEAAASIGKGGRGWAAAHGAINDEAADRLAAFLYHSETGDGPPGGDGPWCRAGRTKVLSDLARYEQILYKKRKEATQATLDAFFSRASLPEASASDEPQPSTSTGGFTHVNVPSLSSSDIDDPGVV